MYIFSVLAHLCEKFENIVRVVVASRLLITMLILLMVSFRVEIKGSEFGDNYDETPGKLGNTRGIITEIQNCVPYFESNDSLIGIVSIIS